MAGAGCAVPVTSGSCAEAEVGGAFEVTLEELEADPGARGHGVAGTDCGCAGSGPHAMVARLLK